MATAFLDTEAYSQAQDLRSLEWDCRIEDEIKPASERMRADDAAGRAAQALARFFVWKPPAVSLGWKQHPPAWLSQERWVQSRFEYIKRPTAGGVALHGSDVSLVIVVPHKAQLSLRSCLAVACRCAVSLCASFGVDATALIDAASFGPVTYCLTEVSPYAVLVGTRKVAGFGARRYPDAWLIQGSLLVRPIPEALRAALPESFIQGLDTRASALSASSEQPIDESRVLKRWAAHWPAWWKEAVEQETAIKV